MITSETNVQARTVLSGMEEEHVRVHTTLAGSTELLVINYYGQDSNRARVYLSPEQAIEIGTGLISAARTQLAAGYDYEEPEHWNNARVEAWQAENRAKKAEENKK